MKRGRIVAYSYFFQEMFLSKDIFLIPYYIAKVSGGQCTYMYTENIGNTQIPKEYRGANIKQTENTNQWRVFLQEIISIATEIDVLFLTGSSAVHMITVFLYKKRNPKGRIVVFGDMEEPQARELNKNGFCYSGGLSGIFKAKLTDYFFHNVTYLVANTVAYELMADLFERKGWNGLLHFYPCIDDEKFDEYGLCRNHFEDKENIMVCVGRIGCRQKNTEMLLNAVANAELKEWKIYMIGPITSSFDLNDKSDFQNTIDTFFKENPEYRDKLIFTGMIYDQKEIFTYYNRAKVLLMTSRHEGFANVYSQAAALGCYIISTDVGGADVCSNNWQYGTKLQQADSEGLAKVLTDIADGTFIFPPCSFTLEEMSYSYRISNVLLPHIKS